MKKNALTIAVGILLIVIFFLLLLVFQVRQSEVAVVTTFGKPTRDVTQPGAYVKWPWPVEKVYKFDQRIQNFEDDNLDQPLTADNFTLLVQTYVGWHIKDPKAFFPKFANGSIAEAERALKSIVRNAKSAVIGRHPLSDLVSTDEKQLKFTAIEKEIMDDVQSAVSANNYGLEIDFLGVKKLGLPESVTTEVFSRMKSERQVLISKLQFEGEAEAAKIRSAADRKSAELIANADADATRIRGLGEAEALKSLEVFQQNPELASFIFRLTALELSLKERATLIFDESHPPFDLFRSLPVKSSQK